MRILSFNSDFDIYRYKLFLTQSPCYNLYFLYSFVRLRLLSHVIATVIYEGFK